MKEVKLEEVNYINARTIGSQELTFIHDQHMITHSENRLPYGK